MKRLIALLIFLTCSATTHATLRDWFLEQIGRPAQDRGTWLCTNCNLPAPYVSSPPGTSFPDVNMFVQAINHEIFAGKAVARWVPNDSITVCDSGAVCLTVYYVAATKLWVPRMPSYPQPPGVSPKVPQNTPQTSLPSGGLAMEPVGPVLCLTCSLSITLPAGFTPAPERVPSVTMILYPPEPLFSAPAIQLIGPSIDAFIGMADLIQVRFGEYSAWSPDAFAIGLGGGGGGGGGGSGCGGVVSCFAY